MYHFQISPSFSRYTNPRTHATQFGAFLRSTIDAYYHEDYLSGDNIRRTTPRTIENIITTLKNQFHEKTDDQLTDAGETLIEILRVDLKKIHENIGKPNIIVCVVPRAKAEANYTTRQLVFKQAVKISINKLLDYVDGTSYLMRHTNTRTTHLNRAGHGGDGDLPYPGITKETCHISENIIDKDILLIDDLYTVSINIDEDAIQALLDHGANSVVFYSLGKTAPRYL